MMEANNVLDHPTFIDWNDKLENAAKNIGDSAKGYKLMHIAEAQKAYKIYNRLMILGIVLGPSAALLTSIEDSFSPDIKPILTIVETICGIFSGIVVAIIKFGKFDEQSKNNKQAAARYTTIESNVRRQLSLYRNDRIPASKYMEWLELKYEELFMTAPLLPLKSYDDYYNTTKRLGLSVPNRYETSITINNENKNPDFVINLHEQNSIINNVSNIVNKVDDIAGSNIDDNVDNNVGSNVGSNVSDNVDNNAGSNVDNNVGSNVENFSELNDNLQKNTRELPSLNEYGDRLLQYELSRLMRK